MKIELYDEIFIFAVCAPPPPPHQGKKENTKIKHFDNESH